MGAALPFDHRGKIKYWNEKKGFGFLRLDSGEEVFAPQNAFCRNITPKAGARIRCDVADSDRGRRATRVIMDG